MADELVFLSWEQLGYISFRDYIFIGMIDAREDLLGRCSRDNLSMAYSRKISRREDSKRDNSFKIRKTAVSKASSPHMQTITKRPSGDIEMLKQYGNIAR